MKPARRNAPIAWITLYGALTGVMALVPIFPYVGGGGYVPLLVPFAAIAPLLLGTAGGILAAIIGGFIGMFIAPAGFPLQVVDVLLTAVLPAVAVGAVIHRRYFIWALLLSLLNAAFAIFFPFYLPGAAAGFQAPPEPVFSLLSAYYWAPPLIVILTPIGRRWLPQLAQSEDRRQKYLGIFLAILTGLFIWFNPWSRPYWYILKYAPSLGVATLIGYTWWVPTLALVITIIAVPLLEALSRSGLPKVEEGLW
ncbi:MAG: hypothetical protein KM310_11635 [Clostridiales bacterium]|nr:hypothetical protein [Clostridiales bacterium]